MTGNARSPTLCDTIRVATTPQFSTNKVNMTEDELRTVQVDFGGLMEVMGKNLYSTPMVAVRELVQNAHDSCMRRRLEAPDPDHAPRITVRGLGDVLEIEDNGAGLTRQEIFDYLATIGAGYTRKLRATHGSEGLIGAFGLGFLSAYVLSTRVEVLTTSVHEPERTWRFVSHTGERFTVTPAEPRGRAGTVVRLELTEAFKALGQVDALESVLGTYCRLLPTTLALEGVGEINAEAAPWTLDADEIGTLQARKVRLEFAGHFERLFEPLATMDIPPSEDGIVTGGLLWIQDGGSYATSDNRELSVFIRGMLVSQDERDLLPAWAGFCGGVINSHALVPTASRESLVRDDAYAQAKAHIREALVAGLERLSRHEPSAWRRALRRHNEALLGAAISDDRLFELVADQLTVPTSEGDLSMREVTRRGGSAVHVSIIEKRGPDEILFRALQRPIVDGTRYAVYPFARRYCQRRGASLVEMGTREGDARMFPRESLTSEHIKRLGALFARERVQLVPTRFQPPALPLVLAFDQEVKLKQRLEDDAADKRISSAVLGLARLYTKTIDDSNEARLYVNLNAPIVQTLLDPARPAEDPAIQAGAVIAWSVARLMAPTADAGDNLQETLEQLNSQLGVLLESHHTTETA